MWSFALCHTGHIPLKRVSRPITAPYFPPIIKPRSFAKNDSANKLQWLTPPRAVNVVQYTGFKYNIYHMELRTVTTRAELLSFRANKDLAPQKRRLIKIRLSPTLIIIFLGCQLAQCPTAKTVSYIPIFRPTV